MIRALLGDYLGLLLCRCVGALAGLASLVLAARLLGPEPYGAVNLLIMSATIPAALLMGWVNGGFLRHAVDEHHTEGRIAGSFWSRLLLFLLGTAVLGAGALVGKAWILRQVMMPEALYPWLLPYAASYALAETSMYWMQAVGRIRQAGVLEASRVILEVGLLGAAWRGWIPLTAAWLLGIQIATRVIQVAAALAWLPAGALSPCRPDFTRMAAMARYSWSMIPGGAVGISLPWLGVYVIQRSMPVAQVGIFQVANQGAQTACLVLGTTMAVTVPYCLRLRAAGDDQALADYRDRLAPMGVWAWSVASGLMSLAAPVVVPLFGAAYADAVLPLQILLAGLSFNSLNVFYYPLLAASDRIGRSVLIAIFTGIFSLAGLWVAVPRWGLLGAAGASALGMALGSTMNLLWVRDLPVPSGSGFLLSHAARALPGALPLLILLLWRMI